MMRWYLLVYLLCAFVLLLQGCEELVALLGVVLDLACAQGVQLL
jgi:hypothetical protein